jgi:outer membrane receptor protein involved in Fe transport
MRGLSAGFAGGQSSASIAPFPNVATYLDDQSLTFPSRNLDIYMVDMERVEVLEGPQGTLFGGGAQAGALRYITNKPKIGVTEGRAEASYGVTAHGDPNTAISAVLNLPVNDKMALRGVFYNDHRGGYIDNVPTTFTRNPSVDTGPSAYSSSYPAQLDTYNNYAIAKRAQNPVKYSGMRLSGLYQINDDWNVLVQQSYQNMDAEGMSVQMPIGVGLTPLGPLEETSFMPAWNKDKASLTSWTLNGKAGDLKLVYTGSYMTRHVDQNMDYTNYARTPGGFYYSCSGGHTPHSPLGDPAGTGPDNASNFGAPGPAHCYSPVMGWHDSIASEHQSHEFRLSTPDDWRFRFLVGAYWEDFKIKDDMNFMQKGIPSCTPENLAAALAGGPICLGNVTPVNAAIDPTTRNDTINFGEDLERGYKQTAAFASVDYDIIPKVLTVTAGTRYYRYTENEIGSQYGTGSGCVNIPNGDCLATPIGGGLDPDPVTGVKDKELHKATYTGFKSRANITWHITPESMVYGTWSQGYRPGAFNRTTKGVTRLWIDAAGNPLANGVVADTAAGDHQIRQFVKPLAYEPDTLTNKEIGFKTTFLNHRLQVNGSIYQMDWKNVQTQIYNPPVYGNTTFGINGPDYRVKGAELQLTAIVTEGLTLMGSMSYNDAKQQNEPCIRSAGVTFYTPGNPVPAGTCITQVRVGNKNIAIPNPLGSVGDTPAFSPKLQFNLRARYDWAVNDYKAFAMVGMNHTDSMNNTPSSFPSGEGIVVPSTTWLRFEMPSYNTYDASAGVAKDAWDAQIFIQNLTNENASTFTSTGQFIRAEVPLRPRVIGVKVALKF